jgi:hypothetical protein
MSVSALFADLVRPRVEATTVAWLDATVDALREPFDPRAFRAEWARAGRRAGSAPVELTAEEGERVRAAGGAPVSGWAADELARAALLARALSVAAHDGHLPLMAALYQRGTIRERQALLRALAWLPDPGRFADLAAEATQTRVVSVFEAIALQNPYPARWLARPLFDQMVRKAVALRLPVERIVGLADRVAASPARPASVRPVPHAALPALLAP